jgi:hypothetical protein
MFVKRERNAAAHVCADYVRRLGSGTFGTICFQNRSIEP